MNTIENNKLLAKFLGWRWGKDTNNNLIVFFIPNRGGIIPEDKLLFHSDWNWLMLVFTKIFDNRLYFKKYISLNSSTSSDGRIELNTNIKVVYEQCVKFVKWYNEEFNHH